MVCTSLIEACTGEYTCIYIAAQILTMDAIKVGCSTWASVSSHRVVWLKQCVKHFYHLLGVLFSLCHLLFMMGYNSYQQIPIFKGIVKHFDPIRTSVKLLVKWVGI